MAALRAQVLTGGEIEQVHEASLRVLSEIGVDVCNDEMRLRLLAAGAKPGQGNARVCFPRQIVEEALGLCPPAINLASVRGDAYRLASGGRLYSSCVVDPFILDYGGGIRPPRLADCADNARLVDAIDLIAMPYKMDIDYVDCTGRAALLQSNLAFMSNMTKHYVCGPHDAADARVWMTMSEIMAGGPLAAAPVVSALISPSSPLVFDPQFLGILDVLLSYGVPLIMLPCPQTGATGPFTLAGTVVDFNAENLATLTLAQILRPGAPVHYHTVAMGFDMRHARASLGGPEKTLLGLAAVDLGRYYNLSCGCAGTATNSVHLDAQNGAESMSQILPAVASTANLITGIGSVGNGMGTSPEQILFDCDLVALAEYLTRGIAVDEDRLALASFERVGPGGDFLSDPLTLRMLRTGEHFYAGAFESSGNPQCTMIDTLHARAEGILSHHTPAPPPARIEDLRRYVEKEARHG